MPDRATMSLAKDGIWVVDPLSDQRWDNLIAKHPAASVFHTRGWLKTLQLSYGFEPVAFTTSSPTDPLTSALLFCKVRSWLTGSRLVSLPFSDHCEPLVEDGDQFKSLCSYAESLRETERWKYVEMRSANSFLNFDEQFHAVATYRLHRLDLKPSLETLRKGFHKDCIQRRIRRAERELLGYQAGHSPFLLQQLYGLLRLTRSRHHLPHQPFEWFQHLVCCMSKDVCIRVAFKDNMPIAGILTLVHGKKVVYKYGGSDARFHHLGAMPMLFWRVIQEAKQAGMEELDLGRSELDNAGLIAFKERLSAVGSTLMVWRSPATVATQSAERIKVSLVRRICSYIPDRALSLVGRLLYRHIG